MTKQELIGKWHSDSPQEYGDVTLEFKEDGTLTYTVNEPGKIQVINLTFNLEGGVLYTDQPSSPRMEKTETIINNGKLSLGYDGKMTVFSKL